HRAGLRQRPCAVPAVAMTAGLGLSLLVSVATGVLLIRAVWPGTAAAWWWPLGTALGAGFGLGLSSVLLYLWMLAFGPTRGFLLVECCLLALVIAIALVRVRREPELPAAPERRNHPVSPPRLLAVAAGLALAAAGAAFLGMLRQQPHGEWDAWMNWDLRARMIFRGGEGWHVAFSSLIPWSHPDYPLMVQSLVVRSWLYAGGETLGGPALVA